MIELSYTESRQRHDYYRNYFDEIVSEEKPTEKWMLTLLGYIAAVGRVANVAYKHNQNLLKLSREGGLSITLTIKNFLAPGRDLKHGKGQGYIKKYWGGFTDRTKITNIRHWLESHDCFTVEGNSGKDCFQTRKSPLIMGVNLEKLFILAEVLHNILVEEFGYIIPNSYKSYELQPDEKLMPSHINTVITTFNTMFVGVQSEHGDRIQWGRQVNEGFAFGFAIEPPSEPKKPSPIETAQEAFRWGKEQAQRMTEDAFNWMKEHCWGLRHVIFGDAPEHQETEFNDMTDFYPEDEEVMGDKRVWLKGGKAYEEEW